jgi:hypothetical protein
LIWQIMKWVARGGTNLYPIYVWMIWINMDAKAINNKR